MTRSSYIAQVVEVLVKHGHAREKAEAAAEKSAVALEEDLNPEGVWEPEEVPS